MADAKKPAAKPAAKPAPSSGSSLNPLFAIEATILGVVAFIAFIVFALLLNSSVLVSDQKFSGYADSAKRYWRMTIDTWNVFYDSLLAISVFLSLLFILGIIYYKFKRKETIDFYQASLPKGYITSTAFDQSQAADGGADGEAGVSISGNFFGGTNGDANKSADNHADNHADNLGGQAGNYNSIKNKGNARWQEIERHMNGNNASEWKVAILEADIILYEMLDQMGYEGSTISEKLKQASPVNFTTLDYAWRAHKIRNIIAHEGASYEISRAEVMNTINLYRKVFEEFYFI